MYEFVYMYDVRVCIYMYTYVVIVDLKNLQILSPYFNEVWWKHCIT